VQSTEVVAVGRPGTPIALLYQAVALHEHLKRALTELGADVVYETETGKFDRASLESSGARVVVINLDPEVEEDIEQLDELLVDDALKVVFNDGEVSSRLEGWDAARWARHLASKILGVTDTNPPRPPGSEAIPVKVKQSAPDTIGAHRIDLGFELAGHELATALAADTGEAIARTRAALVTALEPVAPELMGGEREAASRAAEPDFAAESDADAAAMPAAELLVLEMDPEPETEAPAPAAGTIPPDQRPTLELPQPVAAALPSTLELPQPGAVPLPPTLELPQPTGAALPPTLELPQPTAAALPPTLELPQPDFARLGMPPTLDAMPESARGGLPPTVEPPRAGLAAELPDAADATGDIDEISADFERSLQAFGIGTPDAAVEDDGLALSALDAELALAFDAANAAGPARGGDAPQGLDDLLLGLSLEPVEEADAGSPPATPPVARERAADPPRAGAVPPPAVPGAAPKAAEPASGRSFASFDLSHLSLAPIDGETPSTPVTGRARFSIDEAERKLEAAPAPAVEPAPAPPPAPVAEDALSLDVLEFTLDTVDPLARDVVPQDAERLEAELMAEIAALSAQAERGPAPAAGPIERVWVLGASIGGPDAVREFLGALQAPLPVVFLLAQHMGADFYELMVQQLGRATTLRVRAVGEGERVAHGDVVVVPLDRRLLLDASGVAQLAALEEQSPYSPSIDLVMRDVADRFGANAGAIVFSGMAHDAIDGAAYLASKGGTVWAQDPNTCVISSMVDGAIDAGVVSHTASPVDLARRFNQQFGAG